MEYTKITQGMLSTYGTHVFYDYYWNRWQANDIPVSVTPERRKTVSFSSNSVRGNKVDPTPYSFQKEERTECYGELTYRWRTGSHDGRPDNDKTIVQNGVIRSCHSTTEYSGSYGFSREYPDDSYNKALSDLYEQMRGGLDLSISLAEHASTRRMFKAATQLSRYILQIHPKHWAKHWLEYKYGWSPLVSDLYGAVAEVNHVAAQLQRFRSKATGRHNDKRETFDEATRTASTLQLSHRTRMEVVMTPNIDTISTVSRFTSLNPASIAWELTPFSFVFDWFIDVGSYVRDLESSLALAGGFRSGWVTSTSKTIIETEITGVGNFGIGGTSTGSAKGSFELKTLNRQTLFALPPPRLPRFKPQLGASRLITAASLLKVLFLKEKEPTPVMRKITQAKIQKQLEAFGRGPRQWNNDVDFFR